MNEVNGENETKSPTFLVKKRGGPRPGAGRPKGIPNKFTICAREAFEIAFDTLGGPAGLSAWGKANPSLFYQLYARLIPIAVSHGGSVTVTHEQFERRFSEIFGGVQAETPALPAAVVN